MIWQNMQHHYILLWLERHGNVCVMGICMKSEYKSIEKTHNEAHKRHDKICLIFDRASRKMICSSEGKNHWKVHLYELLEIFTQI